MRTGRNCGGLVLGVLCLACHFGGIARATQYELYATSVDIVDGWNWESNAEGGANSRCHDSVYSSNCLPGQSPPSRSTAYLNASNFQNFTLPPGEQITAVFADV